MIEENVKRIIEELPEGIDLVGAAKTRTPREILEGVNAGLKIIGENYVQEAEKAFEIIGHKVKWHMIGHLQSNKARKAVKIFDMIETVDSGKLAMAINKACDNTDRVMEILIEINSGEETQKAGVMPVDVVPLVKQIKELSKIKIMGLMTMGPAAGDPEESRPFFRRTKVLFDTIKDMNLPGMEMRYLSMGMSNSYKIAIEEGANMVRIGTKLFGER